MIRDDRLFMQDATTRMSYATVELAHAEVSRYSPTRPFIVLGATIVAALVAGLIVAQVEKDACGPETHGTCYEWKPLAAGFIAAANGIARVDSAYRKSLTARALRAHAIRNAAPSTDRSTPLAVSDRRADASADELRDM